MNEIEIRSLPNDRLIEIKEQLLNNRSDIYMAQQTDARVERLEASVSALIAAFKAQAEEEEAKVQMQAEEEEAEKMVPVSKVAEEEKDEEEDKKEEEKEEKLEKLEAQIAQLAAFVASKGKITPDTPDDEPKMTTHKIPKISNEPVESKKPKDGEKLFETPGMKPGKIKAAAGMAKGQSTSFTGAIAKEDVEQKAVDEVFGFAASRGVVPMHADYRVRTL